MVQPIQNPQPMLQNPKTTVAGYVGMVATFAGIIASLCGAADWCHYVALVGMGLQGAANSLGNIMSSDGRH